MLSELNPNELMYILNYFVEELKKNSSISQQRIVNWLMALFDGHITLLISDEHFTQPLKELSILLQQHIAICENCEEIKPYIEQIQFNLPLPKINTDEYIIVDLLMQ